MGRRTEKLVCTFVLGAGMGGGTGRGEAGKEEDTTKRDNEREGRRERPHSAGSSRIDVLRENKRETIIIFCKTHIYIRSHHHHHEYYAQDKIYIQS